MNAVLEESNLSNSEFPIPFNPSSFLSCECSDKQVTIKLQRTDGCVKLTANGTESKTVLPFCAFWRRTQDRTGQNGTEWGDGDDETLGLNA